MSTFTVETATHALRLMTTGLFDRFPRLTVILGHLGRTLNATLAELGADRVLFSTDYPYESMREAADWFDNAAISQNARVKIGHANARRLFPGLPERIGSPRTPREPDGGASRTADA